MTFPTLNRAVLVEATFEFYVSGFYVRVWKQVSTTAQAVEAKLDDPVVSELIEYVKVSKQDTREQLITKIAEVIGTINGVTAVQVTDSTNWGHGNMMKGLVVYTEWP